MARTDISPEVLREIDENLRRAYEELLSEEIPERFSVLIQNLREESETFEASLDDGGSA